MKQIFVILWSYHDGSGFGVVRAYTDEVAANDDLALLHEHCDSSRAFSLARTIVRDIEKVA